jgi:HAE1 family hydrophobic/amphiphilic exporter-1
MRTLADVCIRRPIFAAMIILAMVVVGSAAYNNLGVDRYPSVDLPTVSVRTTLPGASPEEVESQVSQVIEEVVNTVEGIDELRSVSGPGSSNIIATFNLSRDIDVAAQDVRDKVATVVRRLPDEAEAPIVSKFNNDSEPILTVALSGERTVRELTELAEFTVKVQLERSQGVGEIRINGGLSRAINVWVDADRLAAYGLPITAVRDAVIANNTDIPAGNVTGPLRESSLRPMGRIRDPKQFSEIVVATVNGAPVKIRDVGRAEDGAKEQRSVARLNGKPTVTLELLRQSGANTIATIEAAKRNLKQIEAGLPPGVRMQVIRDQSRYIDAALHEINTHLVMGSCLACLVVLRVHAQLADDADRGRGDPGVGRQHVRDDVGAGLHAQQRDDARAGADGRHRHRRRDRRAGKRLPVRRREEDDPVRGGAAGHRRDRAGGARDDA